MVEDERAIAEALADTLRDEGYEVRVAGHGREALDLLVLGTVWRPCVILLDLMMPVMDGWAFRAEQVRWDGLAAIPVVVVSGTRDAPREAERLGAVGVLLKPFDMDDAIQLVARACGED